MRYQLYRIHKWIGLCLALILMLQALSGIILVYRKPIEGWSLQKTENVKPPHGEVSLDRMVSSLWLAWPDYSISRIKIPDDGNSVAVARLRHTNDGIYKFVTLNAFYGGEMHSRDLSHGLMFWMFRWHESLLLGGTGRLVNLGMGILLVFMIFSGLYFWWPLRVRQPLKIVWEAPRKRWWYDVHRVLGVVLLPFLLVSVLTGAGMTVRLLSVSSSVSVNDGIDTQKPWVKLDPVLRQVETYADVKEVRFNNRSQTAAFMLVTENPAWPGGSDKVIVDLQNGSSGAVLRTTNSSFQQKALGWLYPLHSRLAMGSFGQLLVFLLGFGLVAIISSGFWLWWLRRVPVRKKHSSGKSL